MGSFPFVNAVWQKQVTHRSDRCSLEEKQRFSADIGEKRHLDGRSQPSGEWMVEMSEETGRVWVWGHISRVSGGKLRWRRLSLTSIWYFVLLQTQANNVLWVKKVQMPFTLGLNIIRWGYSTHFKTWSHCVSSFVSPTLFVWSIFR